MDEKTILTSLRAISVTQPGSDTTIQLSVNDISMLLKAVFTDRFDTTWYLATYPDVHAAVDGGKIASALDHWINVGVFEGRMPWPVRLDEQDYASRHEDVARSLQEGSWLSASDHFHSVGFVEGRSFALIKSRAELSNAATNRGAS